MLFSPNCLKIESRGAAWELALYKNVQRKQANIGIIYESLGHCNNNLVSRNIDIRYSYVLKYNVEI